MILQERIPFDLSPRKLPGIQPTTMEDWLHRDEAFDGQMARRDALISERYDQVIAMHESARPAALELLDLVLATAYGVQGDSVLRPDGVAVAINRSDPMASLGRLVQEDLCVLQKQGDEHVLTAASLCFPASWLLSEKLMRPLIGIHKPVESYDDNIARRVQRLFDGIQVGRPLWRFNALWYEDPELHQPRSESARRKKPAATPPFLRSERQCLLRLPETKAVVFSIHTYVVPRKAVGPEMQNPA
ncbi:DUF3445 domain-containing protein [Lutimaribacter marinistellae]|uniref:DUF3445 domain-containing protein n=1 Tax=Lutimaribacter marinistellae TaxID=1820329 RepID=A0ABV7TJX3_9RHOB